MKASVSKSRLNDGISIHDYNTRLLGILKPYRLGLQEEDTSYSDGGEIETSADIMPIVCLSSLSQY